MSDKRLREAAALMRERANGAGPIGVLTCELSMHRKWMLLLSDGGTDGERRVAKFCDDEEADHFASWHPTVALAVADWLETTADLLDTNMLNGAPTPVGYAVTGPALAVTDAYLGTTL